MPPIKGLTLVLLTLSISLGMFMNVLDTTITNVAIPTIAGNLGVSPDEGSWIITSFTVSLAIILPMTGWLAKRFGEVRLFVISTFLFTLTSFLCGLATDLQMMIFFRIAQGLVAGPMIPLSQSLLLANYPPEKKNLATAFWATVTVAAPVIGPILGGYITDSYNWRWIFYINIPVGLFSAYFTWLLLKKRETEIIKLPIDMIGMVLLIAGIGALQLLLDKGKDLDWFHSPYITTLTITSIICLIFLVIWELTEKHPIIDLRLFKNRNFAAGTITMSLGFLAYFGSIVILPLWLQTQMNYTPTWAGIAISTVGIIPFFLSPFISKIMQFIDLRLLVSLGLVIFGITYLDFAGFTTDVVLTHIAFIRFCQGLGVCLFFICLITISLSGFEAKDIANAAGLNNFCRLVGGSFGTSITITLWANRESLHQSQLVESLPTFNQSLQTMITQLQALGIPSPNSYAAILKNVINQAYMLATNDIFWVYGYLNLALIVVIWFAKPPFAATKVVIE